MDNRKLIVFECVKDIECPKIFMMDGLALCETYANPANIQHRLGMRDACAVMERPVVETKRGRVRVGQKKTKRIGG